MSKDRQFDTTRKFLESAREARAEYNRLQIRVEEMESRATKVTASMSGMPGGGGGGMEQMWAALADEHTKAQLAATEELRLYHEVEAFINSLHTPMYRILLRLRYLDGLDWEQVQRRLEKDGYWYSDRHITRLHGDALTEARRVWRERGENGGDDQ